MAVGVCVESKHGASGLYVPPNRRAKSVGAGDQLDSVQEAMSRIESDNSEVRRFRQAAALGLDPDEVDAALRVMSAGHMSDLRSLTRVPVGADVPVLKEMFAKTAEGHQAEFFSLRKVVEACRPGEPQAKQVISNVADVVMGKGGLEDHCVKYDPAAKPKKFEVIQLLRDKTLIELFSMSAKFVHSMKQLAIVDTVKAAVKLQEYVRSHENYATAVVSPGVYAKSWKAARDRIIAESTRFPPRQTTVDALFVGEKLFMYAPGTKESWSVFGPERCSHLLRAVHTMVVGSSCQSVAFAYGSELTILDIDIFDGQSVLCPIVKGHVGLQDDWEPVSCGLVEKYLRDDRMRELQVLASAVHTLYSDGQPTASAIRVSKTAVLVNAHVAGGEGLLSLDSESVSFERPLSKDLWLARAEGSEAVWNMRMPEPGERVFLMAKRKGLLELSDPLVLISCDAETLILEKIPFMAPGASGAAVVAMSDFALLGCYGGVSATSGVASAFTPRMYMGIGPNLLSPGASERAVAQPLEDVVGKFQTNGLSALVAANTRAVVALYGPEGQVGYAVKSGSELFTVCCPEDGPYSLESGAEIRFELHESGFYTAVGFSSDELQGCKFNRSPAYGEKVIVLGVDGQGPFFSQSSARVSRLQAANRAFVLSGLHKEDVALEGAVVVAQSDGSVLGIYVSERFDVKGRSIALCKELPDKRVEPVSPFEGFAEKFVSVFPQSELTAWPRSVADLFMHVARRGFVGDLESLEQLSVLGRTALELKVVGQLMQRRIPAAQWNGVKARIFNASYWRKKFTDMGLCRVFPLVREQDLKEYDRVMYALAGAVHSYESCESFEWVCERFGLLEVT